MQTITLNTVDAIADYKSRKVVHPSTWHRWFTLKHSWFTKVDGLTMAEI